MAGEKEIGNCRSQEKKTKKREGRALMSRVHGDFVDTAEKSDDLTAKTLSEILFLGLFDQKPTLGSISNFHCHGFDFEKQLISSVEQVLVSDIDIGYEEIVNTQVLAFNGKHVKNLKGLAEMVENCDDEYMKFNLDYEQLNKSIGESYGHWPRHS